jgi:hypothetical protein
MFRLGGSTSGITSGLDTPKRGLVDGPGGYAGTDYDFDKAFETSQRITDKYYPRKRADLNRFLIDWGLNMVGNPPTGNVLQTAAKQAQGPTKELFGSMDQRDATRSAVGADIFGKIITAEGEMMGEGKVYKDKVMLEALLTATKEKIRITKALETEEDKVVITNLENELIVADTTINQIRKRDPLVDQFLGSPTVIKELLKVILPAYDKALIEDPNNPGTQILKYKKGDQAAQSKKIQDAMAEIMRIIQAGAATTYDKGGRVGYQGGELVTGGYDTSNSPGYDTEGGFETAKIVGGPQPGDTSGSGAPVVEPVGMSFEELRERLPATITDDIVILLSQSAQALEDFATIQTQQDVDNFNTKYNVNLVLPSEG